MRETPDAQLIDTIANDKRIQGARLLSELFALFDALQQHDTYIEQKRAPLKKRYRLFFGAAISTYLLVGFIGWKMTENPMVWVWAWIPSGLLFLGSIAQVLIGFKYQKYDITNEYHNYVRPVLEALHKHIEPNSRVDIDLYLSPVFLKEFLLEKEGKYKDDDGYTCWAHTFERELASIGFRLADGNRVMIKVREGLLKNYKSRVESGGFGGTRKTQVQYRRRISCTITLAVDAEKFVCNELPTDEDRRIYAEHRNGDLILGVKYTEEFTKSPRKKSQEETLQEELKHNRPSYEINQQTLHNLREHGLPRDVLEKLKELKDFGCSEPAHVHLVMKFIVGNEDAQKYRELILKQSESYFLPDPDRIVQGMRTLSSFLQPKKPV